MKIGQHDIFAEFKNDWTQFRRGFNWRTFRLALFEVEDDRMFGAVEATVILLGLGVRVRWTYTITEVAQRLADDCERIKEHLEE